jgi:hypothetical protein
MIRISPAGGSLVMLTRRAFLSRSAASVGVGFAGLQLLTDAAGAATSGKIARGYGPLVRDPNGLMDLPAGFRYRVISRVGQTMDDGLLVPGQPDGMAAFPGPGGDTIIVRNHELEPEWVRVSPFGPANEKLGMIDRLKGYDLAGERPSLGGTTTIRYDTRTGETKAQWMSLAGTNRNCAGGPTPWGTWLTCEEDDRLPGDAGAKDHGWIFEVPADAEPKLHEATPLRDMGRFYHEAVAVHPSSGVIYLTEDRQDACIYRFIPNTPGKLEDGGRLQGLRVVGAESALDTRNWERERTVEVGQRLRVEWVDLENTHAPKDDLRHRAQREHGCAIFARTEGVWGDEDAVYIGCTSGGREKIGQIWTYRPSPHEGTEREREAPATLELFIEPNDKSLVENADNLTIAPWGDLIVCEDSRDDDNLVGVTPDGRLYRFAHNARSKSEFAGVCFSPDGSTLFVNIQSDGLTFAIEGPWDERRAD